MNLWIKSIACGLALGLAGCDNPADLSTPARVAEAAPVAVESPPANAPDAAATAVAAGTPIDAQASKIEFVGSKVTGSHSGGFKSFTGTVRLEEGEVRAVRAEIDMDSTFSDNERLTGHLKSPDFFDVAKHPKAVFESTEIKPGGEKGASHTITGNLTLHGVTKSISFPATIQVDAEGAKINSDFFIKRTDFGIVYPGMPNDLIREEVVIKLAVKAPSKA